MYSPFKMKGKSPMMKALIGKQNNLPAELKAKIEASPAKKRKTVITGDGSDARKDYNTNVATTTDKKGRVRKTVSTTKKTSQFNKDMEKFKENNYDALGKESLSGEGARKVRQGIRDRGHDASRHGENIQNVTTNKTTKKFRKDNSLKKSKSVDAAGTKTTTKINKKGKSKTRVNKKGFQVSDIFGGKKVKDAPTKKRVVGTDADGNKTVSRVNKKGVTRKTKTFKNAPGVTKAGKVEKFRKDGSSKKKVVKGAKTNTITKTNKKGVSKTKVKNNLKTKVKNTGKALGNAGKAVGKGIKSIPKHLDNLGYSLGATAIAGKGLMALTNPAVGATAAMAAGMGVANEIGKGVRNKVKKNKANKKARKEGGYDKKGNPITMKKKSPTKNYKKGYYGA